MWWLVSPGNVLKPVKGMAPLSARYCSARAAARRAPIRVTAIEARLGTRYTVDTLAALRRRYPKKRFVWLMGAGQSGADPPLEGLAAHRAGDADCGYRASGL